jgi:hypothetical protein
MELVIEVSQQLGATGPDEAPPDSWGIDEAIRAVPDTSPLSLTRPSKNAGDRKHTSSLAPQTRIYPSKEWYTSR